METKSINSNEHLRKRHEESLNVVITGKNRKSDDIEDRIADCAFRFQTISPMAPSTVEYSVLLLPGAGLSIYVPSRA